MCNYQIIKDINTFKLFLEDSLITAIQNSVDHNGYKSAKALFTIYDEKGEEVYSGKEFVVDSRTVTDKIASLISEEILNIVDNNFKTIDFESIKLDIDLYEKEKLIELKSISIEKNILHLGENVKLFINIFEKNGISRKIGVELNVPIDFIVGKSNLKVFSGKDLHQNIEEFSSLEELLKTYGEQYENNEIVIKIINESRNKFFEKRITLDAVVNSYLDLDWGVIIDTFEAKVEEAESGNSIKNW